VRYVLKRGRQYATLEAHGWGWTDRQKDAAWFNARSAHIALWSTWCPRDTRVVRLRRKV